MTYFIDAIILRRVPETIIVIVVTNSRAKPQQTPSVDMPLIRCTNVFLQGRLCRRITSPPRSSSRVLVWGQLRSGSCHHPTAATKYNVQPSQATANPIGGKACWFTTLYTQYLLDSPSFEFEIGILQVLNMPRIRCTNEYVVNKLPKTSLQV